jgi:hypothetical protein
MLLYTKNIKYKYLDGIKALDNINLTECRLENNFF